MLAATIIRVACDQSRVNSFVNAINGQSPVIPRNGSIQIPCAIFSGDPTVAGNLVTDLSNVVTANIVIRAGGTPTGTVLFQQVLTAGQLNAAITFSQWQAGTASHFTFTMAPSDSNLTAGVVWIGIGVTTTNAGDISLVYASNAQIKDYGIFNAGAPTAPDYTAWSKAESDGRYAPLSLSFSEPWAPAITSVGDNASGSLEAVATATLPVPALRWFYVPASDQLQVWLLAASTAANADGIQRPNDFNASTNAKVWFRKAAY